MPRTPRAPWMRLATIAVFWATAMPVAAREPSVRIFYTASVKGYIDQCGCPVNPTGGIGRRATYLHRAASASVPTLILDGGDVLGENNDVERLQTEYLFQAMKRLGYHTIGVGPRDLSYGLRFLQESAERYGFVFTSANLIDDATGRPVLAPYTIEEVGSRSILGSRTGRRKVGLISVMGLDRAPLVQPTDPTFRLDDPIEAVDRYVGELRGHVDLVVVMAYLDEGDVDRLLAVDGVDVVLVTRLARIPGEWVVRRGDKVVGYSTFQGRGVGHIDLTLNDAGRITRAEGDLTQLTEEYPDDPAIAQLKREFEGRKAQMLNAAGEGGK